MSDRLELLARAGALDPLDRELARALGRIAGERDDDVLLAAALASRAVQHGHLSADLPRLSAAPILGRDEEEVPVRWPPLDEWLARLRRSPLVAPLSFDPRQELARVPLALDPRGRVYLHRYADYQRRLANGIASRLGKSEHGKDLEEPLSRLFQADATGQRLAAEAAVRHRFSLISGGPGTGKTTTVVRIMALLQEEGPARIRLLAPTGKAAQRLAESIRGQLAELRTSAEVRAALERHAAEASTIHRALGYRPRTPTRFRYGKDRPLACDALIVDEASMIDAALLCKLLEAAPEHARVVLLGDKDQLASVEAGAILGDIWQADLGDRAHHLGRSWRYRESSAIGRLARAVNAGDGDALIAAFDGDEARLYPLGADPLAGELAAIVTERLRAWFSASAAKDRLAQLGRFRVLCAHRRGPHGADALNAAIERHLRRHFGVRTDALYYDGRPILITRNDYQLGLFNGDAGVIEAVRGEPRAHFAGETAGATRVFPVSRLPAHDTMYAMTVHKSQGSELADVALVLPERPSPVLTRELVYTAVSRARERVHVFGAEAVLRHAVSRRIERASGLGDMLASIAPGGGPDEP